jgi:hypothetical protein
MTGFSETDRAPTVGVRSHLDITTMEKNRAY